MNEPPDDPLVERLRSYLDGYSSYVPSELARRRRRRGFEPVLTVSIAVVLVAALAAAVALGRTSTPSTAHQVPPRPIAPLGSVTAAQLAAGHWSQLPPAPIAPRTSPSMVWTGSELLVWGGSSGGAKLYSDGAAYDPQTGHWRVLPPAPLSPRVDQAAVWDGAEMLVWCGYVTSPTSTAQVISDGAAYNPSTNRWRMLPPAPLTARAQGVAVWTGTTMVVLGGYPSPSNDGSGSPDGAAYNPATDRWTHIAAASPPKGHSLMWTSAVQAGSQFLAFSAWATSTSCGPNCTQGGGGTDIFALDEHTYHWRFVPPTADELSGVDQALWTGHFVIARGGMWCGGCAGPLRAQTSAEYDPVQNRWTTLPADPLAWARPLSAWTGGALFSFDATGLSDGPSPMGPREATAYDPASGWVELPLLGTTVPPVCNSTINTPVWTGKEVLVYCPMDPGLLAAPPPGFAFIPGR